MPSFYYRILNKEGLHARPASAIIKLSQNYLSDITIEAKGQTISLKSGGVFALMGLGLRDGDEITIRCEGKDANEALKAIETIVKELI